jgi:hypothetical protein
MRENPRTPRALDLATELALTVGELARKAIEDDPLGMSLSTLPAISTQSTSSVLGGNSMNGAPLGVAGPSPLASNPYDSGSYGGNPYSNTPTPSPYEPAYAAATTMIPQITPEMTTPGRIARPAGPIPQGLPALPPPSAGRPGPTGPGFGAPRGGQGPMPGARPPMGQPGQGQTSSWERPTGYDQRGGRPAGGPPPRQPGYDNPDQRDEYFRSGPPPQQRRPERDEYNGGRSRDVPVRGAPTSRGGPGRASI